MPTVIIGNNTGDDYSGTEDTHIRSLSDSANFGGRASFEITKWADGNHTHALIRFSGLSNLPAGATVSASSINLYCNNRNTGSRTATAKRLLRNWVEGTQDGGAWSNDATWVYYAASAWSTYGGLSDGNDRSSTASGTMTMDGTGYKSVTGSQLNTDIQNIAAGSVNNYGWHLERTDGSNDNTYDVFTSSEGTDGQRPYLSVTYTEGGSSGHPAASRLRNISRNKYVRYH